MMMSAIEIISIPTLSIYPIRRRHQAQSEAAVPGVESARTREEEDAMDGGVFFCRGNPTPQSIPASVLNN